jgi:hypothetical protein
VLRNLVIEGRQARRIFPFFFIHRFFPFNI